MNPMVLLLPFAIASATSAHLVAWQGLHNFGRVLEASPVQDILVQQGARSTWQEHPNFGKYFQQADVEGTLFCEIWT